MEEARPDGALADFSAWLASTSASAAVADLPWLIPAVQTAHIIALAFVVTTMFLFDLRLMGLVGGATIPAAGRRYLPWMWRAVPILLVTGVILIVGEPDRALLSPVFQIKMGLLAAILMITWRFQNALSRDPDAWDHAGSPAGARLVGAISLTIWIMIVAAGRLIAYVE